VLAAVVAGMSLVGLLLKPLPAFYQVNGEIIALALPIHLGVAAGVRALRRQSVRTSEAEEPRMKLASRVT
jgi:hypothetical protein